MPLIKRIADVLREKPDFKSGWNSIEEPLPDGRRIVTGIENPRYGKVERVVVCKDDGTPLFDQYQISEGPADAQGRRAYSSGAVIVPYFVQDELFVGLITRIREVVIDPSTGQQGRYTSRELPRGFSSFGERPSDTAVRELGEETGKHVRRLDYLGKVNPNTAFYVTPGIGIYAAETEPGIVNYLDPNSKEPILKCEFAPYPQVRKDIMEQKLFDGFTLSGLMLFDSRLIGNTGSSKSLVQIKT